MIDRLQPLERISYHHLNGFSQTIETPNGNIELGYNPITELRNLIGDRGVNSHLHMDRAHSLSQGSFADCDIPLSQKWDYVDLIKEYSTEDQIYDRMAYAAEEMIARGVRVMGTFIDIDEKVRYKAINAAQRIKSTFRGATFVLQNQTLKGVLSPEAYYWFREGAELVDHIGGLPGKDKGREEEHLDIVLGTAKALGKKAFVHVDQNNDPDEHETELLLAKTIEHGMEGQVVAIHGISLGAQTDEYLDWLLPQVAKAQIQFITCPRAWIDSRRNSAKVSPIHNPITPVDLLIKHGITVAVGTDNTNDIYKPGSPSDIIPELELIYECCRIRDLNTLCNLATINGNKVLGITNGRGGDIYE